MICLPIWITVYLGPCAKSFCFALMRYLKKQQICHKGARHTSLLIMHGTPELIHGVYRKGLAKERRKTGAFPLTLLLWCHSIKWKSGTVSHSTELLAAKHLYSETYSNTTTDFMLSSREVMLTNDGHSRNLRLVALDIHFVFLGPHPDIWAESFLQALK